MAQGQQRRLGEILQDVGLLTEEQLTQALAEQKQTREELGTILIKMGFISSEALSTALASQFGMQVIKLSEESVDPDVVRRVAGAVARRQRIVPISFEDNTLTVAMANPLDLLSIDNLRVILGCDVKGVLSTPEDVEVALERFYGVEEKTIDTMIQELSERDLSFVDTEETAVAEVEEVSEEAPVIKLVSLLILEAFRARASDIHVEPLENRFRVRYRIDGVLHETPGPPKRLQGAVISRLKIMAGMDIAEKRLPQDGRIKLNLLGKEVDLRVSALPGMYGESVVLRILDKSSLLLGLEELGFFGEDQGRWSRMLAMVHGIILVTGPTGSGKTTTLYASLSQLNQPDRKLITVEDPVEYQLSGINQTQVKAEIGLTFAAALRAILRQAPNIIMIGEIRDFETAEIAIRASLTGHLVFSTLHTNDAPGAVTRLVDMGVKPFLVASGINCVLAQRLVRTICGDCREPYEPRSDELIEIGLNFDETQDIKFHQGRGCPTCNHTGYRGRQGIFELMEMTDAVQEMVMARATTTAIRARARQDGMRTLREDGWDKVFRGITTTAEVTRVTQQDAS